MCQAQVRCSFSIIWPVEQFLKMGLISWGLWSHSKWLRVRGWPTVNTWVLETRCKCLYFQFYLFLCRCSNVFTTLKDSPDLDTTAPGLRNPQVKVKDGKCRRAAVGPRGCIFTHRWCRVGTWTERWPPLFCFPSSAPAISALLLPDSPSPRKTASLLPAAEESGVDNPASHHGDGCLIWDECYITHCSGPPLIHQHLLLLSPCSTYISALHAPRSCCLLDVVRDYLLGKADGYLV